VSGGGASMLERIADTEWYHIGDDDAVDGVYAHESIFVEVEQ